MYITCIHLCAVRYSNDVRLRMDKHCTPGVHIQVYCLKILQRQCFAAPERTGAVIPAIWKKKLEIFSPLESLWKERTTLQELNDDPPFFRAPFVCASVIYWSFPM